MGQASVRHLTGSNLQQGFDDLLGGLPDLLGSAATQYVNLLRRGIRLAGEVLPADLSGLAGSNDCCNVPTAECPPRCVAEIDWKACRGEVQRAVINVCNSGQQARGFTFSAGSIGPAKVEVSPPNAQLAPGQTVAVQLSVAPGDGLEPGKSYSGELLIRGAYEQCVKLSLELTAPQTATVDICQGEAPERITELKWYRHWQCTDPCATGRVTGTPTPVTPNPGTLTPVTPNPGPQSPVVAPDSRG